MDQRAKKAFSARLRGKTNAMIYTIGYKKTYDHYCGSPGSQKKKGGSVWQTREAAQAYLDNNKNEMFFVGRHKTPVPYSEFGIYPVDADWEKDTEPVEDASWRALTKSAFIIWPDQS